MQQNSVLCHLNPETILGHDSRGMKLRCCTRGSKMAYLDSVSLLFTKKPFFSVVMPSSPSQICDGMSRNSASGFLTGKYILWRPFVMEQGSQDPRSVYITLNGRSPFWSITPRSHCIRSRIFSTVDTPPLPYPCANHYSQNPCKYSTAVLL